MKNPSLNQLVGDGNREQAFIEIEKIYIEADKEEVFLSIKNGLSDTKKDVSTWDALFND